MKICYLCADLGIPLGGHKGASAHVRGLLRALTVLGHEVVVVTPRPDCNGSVGARIVPVPLPAIADGISLLTAPRLQRALGHLWNNVSVETVLRDLLRTDRPDLLYERYSPFGVAGTVIAKRLGIPHVLEVNAPLAWEGKQYRKQALQDAAESLERAAFDSASIIVTVSRELKESLAAGGVPPSKIMVVPNGVDVDLFSPHGEAFRDGLEDRMVVGFVGSLKPWHGVDELVESFRRLAVDARFHLMIVGDGPLSKVIDSLVRELPGRVTQTGAVPHSDVPKYLRAMDIAVAPYPALERFYFSPLKVLEYMATGRAVVATGIGQINELIRDGKTGVLVPPGNSRALVEAIHDLAANPNRRAALGMAAAAEVRRRHLWKHRASRILELTRAAA